MNSSSTNGPKLPPSLFRYYPANLQTLENIKQQCFYFGGIGDFNDPFECHVLPPKADGDEAAIQDLRQHYASAEHFPQEVRSKIAAMNAATFRELVKRSAADVLLTAKERFKAERGVSCFSERNENLLMWSHYASGGAGVCLEFDTAHEVFSKAIRVTYRETPPEIDAVHITRDILVRKSASWIEAMYCTKPIDWSYEREWRVIHAKIRTPYGYPKECLKAVYFGPRCKPHLIETICLILQGQNRGVTFHRGSMSQTKYAVEFEPFTYTPFADIPQPRP